MSAPCQSPHKPLPQLPQQALVRCPDCLKLYSSPIQQLKPPRPHFYCPACQSSFWLFYDEMIQNPSGLVGNKLNAITASTANNSASVGSAEATGSVLSAQDYKGLYPLNPKPFRCPRCYKAYEGGQRQCHSCGVVFEKFKLSGFDFLEASIQQHKSPFSENKIQALNSASTPSEIKHMWQHVLHHYDDLRVHRALMQLCVEFQHFAYVAERYKTFLQLYPADKVARCALLEMKCIVEQHLSLRRYFVLEPLLPWPRLLSVRVRGGLLFLTATGISWGLALNSAPLLAWSVLALALTWFA